MGEAKPLGFWSCWALVVGTVIGSGVLLLPTQLAPYGLAGMIGFCVAAVGALALALVFARLASRTQRSGGPYVYTQEAFGNLLGFLSAWALWVSYWIAIPVVATAFVGYLIVFVPALDDRPLYQALAALGVIWTLTLISARGLREASAVQMMMTILKIVPIILVIALALAAGEASNLALLTPAADTPLLGGVAAVALLSLWPFTGFEVGVLPAGNVRDAERVIPRALVSGMLTVAVVYFAAILAVMLLVPAGQLQHSASPFADAARGLGPWGAPLVAAGAMVAILGTLNGVLFCCGQVPMALALDNHAPTVLAKTNSGASPYVSLLLSAALGSILLMANYARGLVGVYTFLVQMSTMTVLLPYLFCALAELRHSWRSAKAWAAVALTAVAFSLFAMFGSGREALWQGGLLTLAGVPFYFWFRRLSPATRTS